MTILHTINKPAHSSLALQNACSVLTPGDTLLFIEDGVFSLVTGSNGFKTIDALRLNHSIVGLLADIHARGLQNHLPEWVRLVDYDGFVALTEEHSQTLSWT